MCAANRQLNKASKIGRKAVEQSMRNCIMGKFGEKHTDRHPKPAFSPAVSHLTPNLDYSHTIIEMRFFVSDGATIFIKARWNFFYSKKLHRRKYIRRTGKRLYHDGFNDDMRGDWWMSNSTSSRSNSSSNRKLYFFLPVFSGELKCNLWTVAKRPLPRTGKCAASLLLLHEKAIKWNY